MGAKAKHSLLLVIYPYVNHWYMLLVYQLHCRIIPDKDTSSILLTYISLIKNPNDMINMITSLHTIRVAEQVTYVSYGYCVSKVEII